MLNSLSLADHLNWYKKIYMAKAQAAELNEANSGPWFETVTLGHLFKAFVPSSRLP